MNLLVPAMVAAMSGAKSEPEMYRLFNEFNRIGTPAEYIALCQALSQQAVVPPSIARKLGTIAGVILKDGNAPVPYRRVEFGRNVNMYVRGAPRRVLAIAFSGRGNNLGIPIALYLQLFGEVADVVTLGDDLQKGFTNGVHGYASTLEAALDRASSEMDFGRYDEVRTFGTSGGGAAALAGGMLLGATVMVSFGGRLPSRSREYGNTPGAALIEQILHRARPSGRAFAVAGQGNARDIKNAQLLGKVAPIENRLIPGCDDHNTVYYLVSQGTLASFLREIGLTAPPQKDGAAGT